MTKVDTKDNTIEDGDNDDNDDIDDDDDTTIKHRRQYDSETATGDGTTVDNNATNSNADVVDSAASVRKRTTIDESTLSAEDLHKLESRRAYNRHCAAKARKRSKTLVAQLQSQVEELTKDKAELKRSNDLMRTQLDLLEQQNRTLLMSQMSTQSSSSQINDASFMPGCSASSSSNLISNNGGNPAIGSVNSMSSGNPMFNLSSARFSVSGDGAIGSSRLVGGASGLSNASTSYMGVGAGGGGSSLGQLSLLDRLRLQQQLQLHQQQQQFSLIAPSSGGNARASLNDQETILNNNTKQQQCQR